MVPRDDIEPEKDIQNLFWWAWLAAKAIGAVFGIIFAAVQASYISLTNIVWSLDPDFFVRVALIIYYNCWFISMSYDVTTNKMMLVVDPDGGRVSISFFIVLPLGVAAAVTLVLVSNNLQHLVLALTGLFVMDVVMWFNYVRVMGPKLRANEAFYAKQGPYFAQAQVSYARRSYFEGQWQYFRFGTMGSILSLMVYLMFVEPRTDWIGGAVSSAWPVLPAQKVVPFICALLFLLYVVVGESWSWYMRVKLRAALQAVALLRSQYALLPRFPV